MDFQKKVACILPSAGSGERMAMTTPKQFCVVAGKSLICHTVEGFLRIPWISPIVVVAAENSEVQMKVVLQSYMSDAPSRVRVVTGGATRHKSIVSGIQALKTDSPEYVVIHDGVRPQVPEDILRDLLMAAHKDGAAGVSRPLVSTVLAVDEENYLISSLDRSKFLASEMPQVFRYSVIKEAYSKCSDFDFNLGTECLELVLTYCNIRAKVLPGPPELWKVTHKRDLYAAELILKDADNFVNIVEDSICRESPFQKYLIQRFKDKYKANMDGHSKKVFIHDGETISSIVEKMSRGLIEGKVVHITHDPTFIGNSESVEIQERARKAACNGIIICCNCTLNEECSGEGIVELASWFLDTCPWASGLKVLLL